MNNKTKLLNSQSSPALINFLLDNYDIDLHHFNEWVKGSNVDPEIVKRNVRSVKKSEEYRTESFLFEIFGSKKRKEKNGHKLVDHKARQVDNWNNTSGFIITGIDPLTGKRMEWSRIKPDSDSKILESYKGVDYFTGKQKKVPKYLSPQGEKTRPIFLDVPEHIWKEVARKNKVDILEEDKERGFWPWVLKNEKVRITIVEGEKKAGALLTKGHAAISIPGIWNGRRYTDNKKKTGEHLVPELRYFCKEGRWIDIVFDRDTKKSTIKQVQKAQKKLGKLLEIAKASDKTDSKEPGPKKPLVKVFIGEIPTNQSEKMGIDDYFVSGGEYKDINFTSIKQYKTIEDEERLEQLKQCQIGKFKRERDFTPHKTVSQKYFDYTGDIERGEGVAIKSQMGTGKTEWIAKAFQSASIEKDENGKIIGGDEGGSLADKGMIQIGSTNALVRGTANRIPGAKHLQDNQCFPDLQNPMGRHSMCIESLLHTNKIPIEVLGNKVLLLDEVLEVISHLLSGSTPRLAEDRESYILTFNRLLKYCHSIVLMDANMSDEVVEYIESVSRKKITKIENVTKKDRPEIEILEVRTRKDESYLLEKILKSKCRVYCPFASQAKAEQLERMGKEKNKKVLRIDQKTLETSGHPAREFTRNPQEYLLAHDIDILVCSPSIRSGVDLGGKLNGYFGLVVGWMGTHIKINDQIQMIGRLRDTKVKILVGIDPKRIKNSSQKNSHCSEEKYQEEHELFVGVEIARGAEDMDIDSRYIMSRFNRSINSEAGKMRAKQDARFNIEKHYPVECFKIAAQEQGYLICMIRKELESDQLALERKVVKAQISRERAEKIFNVESINEEKYESLLERDKALTEEESAQLKKYYIMKKFPGIENEPSWSVDLIQTITENSQKIGAIERFYTFINDGELARKRKKKIYYNFLVAQKFAYDIKTDEKMEIIDLLKGPIKSIIGKELVSKFDKDVIHVREEILKSKKIKGMLKAESCDAIKLVGGLLEHLGLKLKFKEQKRTKDGSRARFYSVQLIDKKLEEVKNLIYSCLDRKAKNSQSQEQDFDKKWEEINNQFVRAQSIADKEIEGCHTFLNSPIDNNIGTVTEKFEKIESELLDKDIPMDQIRENGQVENPSNEEIEEKLTCGRPYKQRPVEWLRSLIYDYGWEKLKRVAIRANLGAFLQSLIKEAYLDSNLALG